MRDLQKERELLEKDELDDVRVFSAAEMEAVGLAEPRAGGHDEAPATSTRGARVAAESISRPKASGFQVGLADTGEVGSEAPSRSIGRGKPSLRLSQILPLPDSTTAPTKGHRKPVRARSEARHVETALEALMRLSAEAAATAGRLEAKVDLVAGKSNEPWRKNKLQLARNVAAEMVERLLAFVDRCAGDPDHEPSLATLSTYHQQNQAYLCFTSDDDRELDLDIEEADELEEKGESNLGWTECIDQRHIAQGDWKDREGEMNFASTNGIDQRWSLAGSRRDREVDTFPYDPPKPGVEGGVRAWEAMERARQEIREELRRRGFGEPLGATNVALVRFGRR